METKVEYRTESQGEVDLHELAEQCLKWRKLRLKLDKVEAAIEAMVLPLRKTQTIGDVRASFFNPRNSYDYETPVKDRLDDPETGDEEAGKIRLTIANCSKTVVDWRDVCKFRQIDPIVTPGTGPGSVRIKLLS